MGGNRKWDVVIFALVAVAIHAGGEMVDGKTYIEGWALATLELVDDVGGPAVVLFGDGKGLVGVAAGEGIARFMEGACFASVVVAWGGDW